MRSNGETRLAPPFAEADADIEKSRERREGLLGEVTALE